MIIDHKDVRIDVNFFKDPAANESVVCKMTVSLKFVCFLSDESLNDFKLSFGTHSICKEDVTLGEALDEFVERLKVYVNQELFKIKKIKEFLDAV